MRSLSFGEGSLRQVGCKIQSVTNSLHLNIVLTHRGSFSKGSEGSKSPYSGNSIGVVCRNSSER